MGRKKQRKRPNEGCNSHHLLFYRKNWSIGYKQLLRRSFVYELPEDIHSELHATLGSVPPLDEEDAKWLWMAYCQERRTFDLIEALEWLQLHAPNSEFAIAIMAQLNYLRNKMKTV